MGNKNSNEILLLGKLCVKTRELFTVASFFLCVYLEQKKKKKIKISPIAILDYTLAQISRILAVSNTFYVGQEGTRVLLFVLKRG